MTKINGIYIHIPFCSIKCPYCDFTSITINDKTTYSMYIETLKKELHFYTDLDFHIETIYFGGGTPSLLGPSLIGELINFIKNNFSTEKDLEITIEVNPNTYRYKEFQEIIEYNVNRLSIGNQTFNKKLLKNLGRDHDPEDTLKMVEDAVKAGIKNINLDLIYGIENQTLEDLEKDLKIYTSLPIKHISAYMLTPYESTPLGKLVEKNEYSLPDEKLTTDMFYLINEYLENNDFKRYELSNWAKKGYECKHNLLYWTDKHFLGIGVSAWSYIENKRFGNTKNIYEYFEKVKEGIKPVSFKETLDKNDKRIESIMLGLRLKKGIDLDTLKDKKIIIQELIDNNLAGIENNRFYLTEKGLMVINKIVEKLI